MISLSNIPIDDYIRLCLDCGHYYVDFDVGDVYSRKKNGIRKLTPLDNKGYARVKMYLNGISRMCYVHRVVAIASYRYIPSGMCVDHINNIKSDNRLSNLQFLTQQENVQKAIDDGLYSGKLNPEQRKYIYQKHIIDGVKIAVLAKEFNVHRRAIWGIVKGEWNGNT